MYDPRIYGKDHGPDVFDAAFVLQALALVLIAFYHYFRKRSFARIRLSSNSSSCTKKLIDHSAVYFAINFFISYIL